MDSIIIMGAGANLEASIKNYNQYLEKYNILGVWDNDERKIGKIVRINNREYRVELPSKPPIGTVIVVSSHKYYEEIRESLLLTKELGLDKDSIQKFVYLKKYIIDRIINEYKDTKDAEIKDILRYLKNGGNLSVFMSIPQNEQAIQEGKFEVFWDDDVRLFYSFWNGKRIYIKRTYNTELAVKEYLKGIYLEQTPDSPHCYEREGFKVNDNDILVDAGAAEGFFSLDNIENAKKIIIVENDPEWIEALKCTFSDYGDKVEIIDKLLSDCSDNQSTTLDEIDNKLGPITYIKMDIEGFEKKVLRNVSFFSENREIRIIACTYHYKNDQLEIEKILTNNGFKTNFSKGYMYFNYYEGVDVVDLRRGLCFGVKERRP